MKNGYNFKKITCNFSKEDNQIVTWNDGGGGDGVSCFIVIKIHIVCQNKTLLQPFFCLLWGEDMFCKAWSNGWSPLLLHSGHEGIGNWHKLVKILRKTDMLPPLKIIIKHWYNKALLTIRGVYFLKEPDMDPAILLQVFDFQFWGKLFRKWGDTATKGWANMIYLDPFLWVQAKSWVNALITLMNDWWWTWILILLLALVAFSSLGLLFTVVPLLSERAVSVSDNAFGWEEFKALEYSGIGCHRAGILTYFI